MRVGIPKEACGAFSMATLQEVGQWTKAAGKRLLVTVVGFLLLGAGLVLMILPIVPGLLVVVSGLVVLSAEYFWATRALDKGKKGVQKTKEKGGKAKERVQEKLDGLGE
ncbi:MAG: hypothetical protein M3454_01710 [Actinomycetota bacterium]|nr:hypothetical protein [Actinomycetota bacterium]